MDGLNADTPSCAAAPDAFRCARLARGAGGRTTGFARSSVQADEAATRRPGVERKERGTRGKEETGMIVKPERRSLVVSTLAVLFLGLAGSAWGHGFSRGAFGRSGVAGLRGPHSGGLLLRLIFPCRGDCFDAARTCDETAESAAVTCAEQAGHWARTTP